jgi:cell wall-associated NlpC family hydrolase
MSNQWPPLRPNEIVEKAREFLGTPWHHDARIKGVGIDCTGLLACTLAELGVPVQDQRGYNLGDQYDQMRDAVAVHADLIGIPAKEGREFGYDDAVEAWTLRGMFDCFEFKEYGDCILRPGDVFLFRNTDLPPTLRMLNHCGIYTGNGCMIHAWNAGAIQKVAEHPIDSFWVSCISELYRYKGLVIE